MKVVLPLGGLAGGVLKALSEQKEMNGASLLRALGEPARCSIYTTLDRLEKGGWVKSRYEKRPHQRTRTLRFVQLTKVGKKLVALDQLLADEAKKKGRPC